MVDTSIVKGQDWLTLLLQKAGLSVTVTGSEEDVPPDNDEGASYWLTIDEANLSPEQISTLIGSNGSVLDAIQYLTNSILNLNQPPEEQASYTIELNGYRVKREAEIRTLAENAAAAARASGNEIEIKSLSSAERRQVHTFLKDYADLETFSRGKEPHRHLVVRPAME
ncbi:single-stranded nucleic acid binding R3H domain-containing protein [Rivularia sp. IAM M-261]|nr:single-stranded nucleic acid binding R3H domain-containing protein [Calothrix sp. PCC 7716]GJD18466.1 single-stranded nucleic acid binding R3H domain-containing protein [Rivularia sp. IAM M-261]